MGIVRACIDTAASADIVHDVKCRQQQALRTKANHDAVPAEGGGAGETELRTDDEAGGHGRWQRGAAIIVFEPTGIPAGRCA